MPSLETILPALGLTFLWLRLGPPRLFPRVPGLAFGAGIDENGGVLVITARETSPSEWRAGVAEAASIVHSYADAASVEASGIKTVFERRVRLTVLRATGLAQVLAASDPT